MRQYREGYEPLVESKNKEVVTVLREIAAGKVLPDLPQYTQGLDLDRPETQPEE